MTRLACRTRMLPEFVNMNILLSSCTRANLEEAAQEGLLFGSSGSDCSEDAHWRSCLLLGFQGRSHALRLQQTGPQRCLAVQILTNGLSRQNMANIVKTRWNDSAVSAAIHAWEQYQPMYLASKPKDTIIDLSFFMAHMLLRLAIIARMHEFQAPGKTPVESEKLRRNCYGT